MKLSAVLTIMIVLAGSCGNVGESRGGPRHGQVTNAQWSDGTLTVHSGGSTRTLSPGEHTPNGARYDRFCIPSGFTGSARIATDDNPAGFPPTRVAGGSCRVLKPRDIATVTVED